MKKTDMFIKEDHGCIKFVFGRSERYSTIPERPNLANGLEHVVHLFQLAQTRVQLSTG